MLELSLSIHILFELSDRDKSSNNGLICSVFWLVEGVTTFLFPDMKLKSFETALLLTRTHASGSSWSILLAKILNFFQQR